MNNLNDLICKNCHIALLYDHPESKLSEYWVKCILCGYCEKKDLKKREQILKNQQNYQPKEKC
jgi:hypothetical protein